MQNIWMLSPFTTDTNGQPYPTCSAYATGWMYPMLPKAATAPVSVSHVQDASNSAADLTSVTATFATPTTVGNLIMITVIQQNSQAIYAGSLYNTPVLSGAQKAPLALVCSDSGGNNYTNVNEVNDIYDIYGIGSSMLTSDEYYMDSFFCITTSSASAVTVSFPTGGTYASIQYVSIHEYSGVDPVRPLITTNAGFSGMPSNTIIYTAPTLTVSLPTTTAGELVFAVGMVPSNATLSIDSGFTSRGGTTLTATTGGGTFVNTFSEWDYICASSGAANVTFTSSSAGGVYDPAKMYGYVFAFQPTIAATGKGLVYCQSSPSQISAAQADPSIVVCSTDVQAKTPLLVSESYYLNGVINGMTLAEVLSILGRISPSFLTGDVLTQRSYIPFHNLEVATGSTTQSTLAVTADQIAICPLILNTGITFSNFYIPMTGSDAVNLHSFGVYDDGGQLVVSSTPRIYPSNGLFNVAATQLSAGIYYTAWTCNGTSVLSLPNGSITIPGWVGTMTTALSSSSVLPPSITVSSSGGPLPFTISSFSMGFL